MISFSDSQLQIVMRTARSLPPERRDLYLQRCAAMLRVLGMYDDAAVERIAKRALVGLLQSASAA